MKIKTVLIFPFLFLMCLIYAFGQYNNGTIYFNDLFISFNSDEELAEAKARDADDLQISIKEGAYYFVKATGNYPPRHAERKKLIMQSIEILEKLWKKNRRNNKICLLLAYSYVGYCAEDIPLEDVMNYVFKARNLFSIVVARLPENIDARLGRVRININLTPQTGRPDDVVLKDAEVYFSGYKKLSTEEQERIDLKLGLMEMRLAYALIWHEKGNKEMAWEYFNKIQPDIFMSQNMIDFYEKLIIFYGE